MIEEGAAVLGACSYAPARVVRAWHRRSPTVSG
jgi:hypothetical protein